MWWKMSTYVGMIHNYVVFATSVVVTHDDWRGSLAINLRSFRRNGHSVDEILQLTSVVHCISVAVY